MSEQTPPVHFIPRYGAPAVCGYPKPPRVTRLERLTTCRECQIDMPAPRSTQAR